MTAADDRLLVFGELFELFDLGSRLVGRLCEQILVLWCRVFYDDRLRLGFDCNLMLHGSSLNLGFRSSSFSGSG